MCGACVQLVQELSGHGSYINALCFDEDGARLYSGDSLGSIRLWNVFVTDKPSSRGVLKEWSLHKEINESEIKVGYCLATFAVESEQDLTITKCQM